MAAAGGGAGATASGGYEASGSGSGDCTQASTAAAGSGVGQREAAEAAGGGAGQGGADARQPAKRKLSSNEQKNERMNAEGAKHSQNLAGFYTVQPSE